MEFKKAIKYYVNSPEYYADSNSKLEDNEFVIKMNSFLNSNDTFSPSNISHNNNKEGKDKGSDLQKLEDELVSVFKSHHSQKTITNITELLFMLGENYIKDCGFWLKSGLVNNNKTAMNQLPRHLVIGGLVYSQLGQSLIAEGMYRQCIDLLKDIEVVENRSNLSFALNMYGKLLLRIDKRHDEANKLLEQSEKIIYQDWYKTLTKLHYFDFDFE